MAAARPARAPTSNLTSRLRYFILCRHRAGHNWIHALRWQIGARLGLTYDRRTTRGGPLAGRPPATATPGASEALRPGPGAPGAAAGRWAAVGTSEPPEHESGSARPASGLGRRPDAVHGVISRAGPGLPVSPQPEPPSRRTRDSDSEPERPGPQSQPERSCATVAP
jgi:hypothetical protein